MQATKETSLQLYDMARALVAERKREPLDPPKDATSALLAARVDGEPLPDEMIVGTIRQVLVVGIIAPTVMIGSHRACTCRAIRRCSKAAREPQLSAAAVEEFLRLYTPTAASRARRAST